VANLAIAPVTPSAAAPAASDFTGPLVLAASVAAPTAASERRDTLKFLSAAYVVANPGRPDKTIGPAIARARGGKDATGLGAYTDYARLVADLIAGVYGPLDAYRL
jgi:hypothetical protein